MLLALLLAGSEFLMAANFPSLRPDRANFSHAPRIWPSLACDLGDSRLLACPGSVNSNFRPAPQRRSPRFRQAKVVSAGVDVGLQVPRSCFQCRYKFPQLLSSPASFIRSLFILIASSAFGKPPKLHFFLP